MDQNYIELEEIDLEDNDQFLLTHSSGFLILKIKDIIRLEGNINYTKVFLASNKQYTVSKSLLEFEKVLSPLKFCRTHKSHIINLNYVQEFSALNYIITLTDGCTVPLSRRRMKNFNEIIKNHTIHF